MKKPLAALLLLLALFFTSCSLYSDPVIESLGKPTSEAFYSSDGFQDYTDYGIYTFEEVDLSQNEYFKPITAFEQGRLELYLDDYEQWVEMHRENDPEGELSTHYDFDRDFIDDEDYCYISVRDPANPIYSYDIYFFDTQSNTLYFFHNNI